MATRTIYLIRHGHHDLQNNTGDELGGGLTPTGVKQAELTAQRFRWFPINAIYTSSLRRAAETAEIIVREFPDIPLQKSKRLWERIVHVSPKLAESLNTNPEKMAEQTRLVEKVFEKRFKCAHGHDKHEIIVSHGNLIRYFVCRVMQVRPEAWINMDMCNCGVSEVLIRPDGSMLLVSHSDVGHLPPHLRTYSRKEMPVAL